MQKVVFKRKPVIYSVLILLGLSVYCSAKQSNNVIALTQSEQKIVIDNWLSYMNERELKVIVRFCRENEIPLSKVYGAPWEYVTIKRKKGKTLYNITAKFDYDNKPDNYDKFGLTIPLNKDGHVLAFSFYDIPVKRIDTYFFNSFPKLMMIDAYKIKTPVLDLKGLKYLEYASFNGSRIKKIENLRNLPALEEIDLSYNNILKLENISGLPKLKKLDLSMNDYIEKIEGLDALSSLEYLDFRNGKRKGKIKKIEGLSNLKNLKDLTFVDQPISKIEGLDNLSSLKSLSIIRTKIKKIEGFDNLVNLKSLSLSDLNGFEDHNLEIKMSGLENLKKLESLFLADNNIKKISGLSGLHNLLRIDLSDNAIEDFSGLNEAVNLEKVVLINNEIKKIEGLSLPKLKKLDLSFNNFQKFSDISLCNLKNLQELNFESEYFYETFSEQKGIAELGCLDNLRELVIAGTAIDSISGYEQLENLDDIIIGGSRFEKMIDRGNEEARKQYEEFLQFAYKNRLRREGRDKSKK